MTFLPVVERELRVAARRRHTYWTRFAGALIAMIACTWIWLLVGDSPQAELPKTLFDSLSVLAYLYSLAAGLFVTADCLSEEKRDGTLGLLFLTDLKGYDVVLGKLVATSVNSFYGLVAVFPVLAIPILFGGLTPGEFWRMVLVLANTLFFSLSVGMFVSAISRQARKAMIATFFLLFLFTVVPLILGLNQSVRQNSAVFNPAYALVSSSLAFGLASDKMFVTAPAMFWVSLVVAHLEAWVFLALASIFVRHSWQDRPAGKQSALWWKRWEVWKFGDAPTRAAFRERLLNVNPCFWLAGRNRLKPAYVYAAVGLAGCAWLWLYLKFRGDMLDAATYIATAILLHTALKFWVAAEACRPLAEDRRSGALELLLSTPLSVDRILQGQMLALKRQFGGAVAIILLADFAMFLGGLRNRVFETSDGWATVCLVGISTFVADLYTLAWVGMWLGLTARKANWAPTATIGRVILLPCFLFCVFVTVSVFVNFDRGQLGDPGDVSLGAWFVIGMLNDLFFLTRSRSALRHQFRTIVAERFEVKKPRRWLWKHKEKWVAPTAPAQA